MKHKPLIITLGVAALLGALAFAKPENPPPTTDPGDAYELHVLTVEVEDGTGGYNQQQPETFLVDEVNGRTCFHSKMDNEWKPILFPGGGTQPPPASRGWRISQGFYPAVGIPGIYNPYLVSAGTGRTYILSGFGNGHGETYHWIELFGL